MGSDECRFPVMGSEAHVRVLGGEPNLADRARARLEDLEQRWSRFCPDSEISQLNRSGGQPRIVSPETYEVVSAAIEAWRWSGGRFDPTTAATMVAAGYDRTYDDLDGTIIEASHRACATPADITLDPYPRSITLPADVSIDLGGIGKGAAADLVAAELLALGAEGCCVNVGGDLRVAGTPPRPEGWLIDIEIGAGTDPGNDSNAARHAPLGSARPMIGLIDGAVCTSTTTRRTWTSTLGPEHHLRDPADGRPLDAGLMTVTVIGAEALQGEVLTKTAIAAGPTAGAELITSTGATGMLATTDGRIIELDGLAPFLAAAMEPPRSSDRAHSVATR